jgi:hypothetical protein
MELKAGQATTPSRFLRYMLGRIGIVIVTANRGAGITNNLVFSQGFTFHKLHRVKVITVAFTQMKHRGHIGMPDAGCCSGFPDKTATRRGVTESRVNDL